MAKTISQLFASIPAELRDMGDLPVTDLSTNSDSVQEGSLFFAVRGTTRDGHEFCQQALDRGAMALVVEDRTVAADFPTSIYVPSTRAVLGPVASNFYDRPTKNFDVVAVTGTNGKTTTTHLLEQACRGAGQSTGMVGTIRYQVGSKSYPAPLTTPDPLALQKLWSEMRDARVQFAAIEASSIALDQFRLSGTRVRAAVFTNLTQDHLDYHQTMDRYFEAKLRLFTEFAPEIAVINIDDSWGERLAGLVQAPKKFTYSVTGKAADFALLDFQTGADNVKAHLQCLGKPYMLRTRLLGRHNLANILGATATLHGLGWTLEKALALLCDAPGAPGRLERVGQAGTCEVLVDYAHSDDALLQVLMSLQQVRAARGGRILTVFGCGGDRDKTKRPKMAAVVSDLSDVTMITSDNPRTEDPNRILDDIEKGVDKSKTHFLREVDRRKAIYTALSLARPEDLVLIAGKGHETYQIIGTEKLPFDDREVVREYFQTCSRTFN